MTSLNISPNLALNIFFIDLPIINAELSHNFSEVVRFFPGYHNKSYYKPPPEKVRFMFYRILVKLGLEMQHEVHPVCPRAISITTDLPL